MLFGVKKYADALWEICKDRDIEVNLQRSLVEVRGSKREAVFQNLLDPEDTIVEKVNSF